MTWAFPQGEARYHGASTTSNHLEHRMNFNNVTFERSFGISSQLPPSTLPEVAFAGRSNVGK